eukprot:Blabericola_migrator_1__7004@NODE_354_length_9484_cov_115_239354_g283_i0_p6_GENE_NODE_354_length_9484_cov_115_239354_g283_i0NODE_354_length_9484_cov_115_239354_g283_i0_p6_ORF_typecomplete_len161_score0_67MBOAT/PF03062_19/3_3e06Peptidase_M11/PF05548_11/0_21Acyltransferase/PF01553_21/0_21_NODE_354_length_9484_cov_115_239354_g283_i087629244
MDRYWSMRPPRCSYNSLAVHSDNQKEEPMVNPPCIATMAQTRCREDYNLLFLMSYAFFLPLYIAGPIIPFNAFCYALRSRASPKRRWLAKVRLGSHDFQGQGGGGEINRDNDLHQLGTEAFSRTAQVLSRRGGIKHITPEGTRDRGNYFSFILRLSLNGY